MGLLSSLFGGGKSDGNQTEKQEKKNFEILKYDGIRARNIGKIDYATKCFEEAIALNKEPETMGLLANIYLQAGRTEDAYTTLKQLTEAAPENSNAWLAFANVCYMQEDYTTMKYACQQVLQLNTNNATAYLLTARAERGLKNDLQAIVMLTKAIMQDETSIDAYLLRAETLWDMCQVKDATEDVEKVLQLNADNEEALLLKGKIEAAKGNMETALQCFDQVAALNPFHEKAYLLKGELLIEVKDFDKAIENYTEALELIPDNAHLYQERGRARLLKEDKAGATSDMKRAIELTPESESMITGNFKIQ